MAKPFSASVSSRAARLVPTVSGAIELIGRSRAIMRTQELVRRAASLDDGVLLVGERGADVESVARELHARGRPVAAPWVSVNCGVHDAGRLDRDLFGAASANGFSSSNLETVSSDCRVVAARGGTLFLQDVTDLPAAVQARLARIVRDGEVLVDGTAATTRVRFVGSALPTVDADVRESRFRPDLFRRLAASRIDLPALRDRADDVAAIAVRVLEDFAERQGVAAPGFTRAALALLSALTWPGNVGELRSVVELVAAQAHEHLIQVEHLLPALQLGRRASEFAPSGNLREARLRFEREYIAAVLQHHGWRMAEAARTLGIQRPNLYRKARQLGVPVSAPTRSK